MRAQEQEAQGLVPTTLSYSSSVSLSPAVLLKLLVLEEEREMFDLPFSFSLMNGLGDKVMPKEMTRLLQAELSASWAPQGPAARGAARSKPPGRWDKAAGQCHPQKHEGLANSTPCACSRAWFWTTPVKYRSLLLFFFKDGYFQTIKELCA